MDIENLKEEIRKLEEKGIPVIVEGKKDKRAMESLGLRNILMLDGRPLFDICESIQAKEVAILTDLDTEGRKLYSSIYKTLVRRGIKVDNKLRLMLFKAKLSHIEGLDSYLQKQA